MRKKFDSFFVILRLISESPKTLIEINNEINKQRSFLCKQINILFDFKFIRKEVPNLKTREILYIRVPIEETLIHCSEKDLKISVLTTFLAICESPFTLSGLQCRFDCDRPEVIPKHIEHLIELGMIEEAGGITEPIYVATQFLEEERQFIEREYIDPIPKISYPAPGVLRHHCVG